MSQNTQCRYFLHGVCYNGENCQFAHSINARADTICRFYQRGCCAYGAGCRYDHVRSARHNNDGQTASGSDNSNIQCDENNRSQENRKPKTTNDNGTNSKSNATHAVVDTSFSKLRPEAKEFIPSTAHSCTDPITYSQAVGCGHADSANIIEGSNEPLVVDLLCPYNLVGHCWYGDSCSFVHGDICDFCNAPALHPTNKEQRASHRHECIAVHEKEMESAFAEAKSREKQCGICMEVVLEKSDAVKQRFGVLPDCKHCFCLECIRRWRQAKTFENKIIRACPECRTVSDFVVPSSQWVDTELEKKELIDKYRTAMKSKVCKYFARGNTDGENDECPFGNKCFYRHQTPDGKVVEGDSPRTIRARQRLKRQRAGGNDGAVELLAVWSFLRQREASSTSSGGESVGGGGGNTATGVIRRSWDDWGLRRHMASLRLDTATAPATGGADNDDSRAATTTASSAAGLITAMEWRQRASDVDEDSDSDWLDDYYYYFYDDDE